MEAARYFQHRIRKQLQAETCTTQIIVG
uniref:Uncharacterized protein n=1 Tax=Arundo donax TaxID=35708 RepID=A0A0A8ZZ39_ARUDO